MKCILLIVSSIFIVIVKYVYLIVKIILISLSFLKLHRPIYYFCRPYV